MKILGALLAGGRSLRFGSDKAFAIYKEQYLIDHAIGLLQEQCDAIIICGRTYKDYESIQDDPANYGPLGGVNAALKFAKKHNFDAVISFPCDTIRDDRIRGNTIEQDIIIESKEVKNWFKDECPAYFISQPVIGYWPCTLSGTLERWLQNQKRRSMIAWAKYCRAKAIDYADMGDDIQFININKTDDLVFSK